MTLTESSVKGEIGKYLRIPIHTNKPFYGIESKIINNIYTDDFLELQNIFLSE